ncbi:hypothetical protein [Endozoicomonas sp. 4G]|uniref:hypothetical protein n=1 Tax=Endozoicomonas sp. 4G TaxID=2872754 RepID=UPI0020790750|nr:hypothetical protein [Endozoicomonas sp. 4G]
MAGHSSGFSNTLGWVGLGHFLPIVDFSETIKKLPFIENNPALHSSYDLKTVPELERNQLFVSIDGKSGDVFHFCFRTPPALSVEYLPTPPVITRSATEQIMLDMQAGSTRLVELAAGSGRWQFEHQVSWRIPEGKQSLILSVEDNDNEWVLEPSCSGIFSETTGLTLFSDGKVQTKNPGHSQQKFVLNSEQLLSVSVFPGSCPTGIDCRTESGKKKGASHPALTSSSANTQSQAGSGSHSHSSDGTGNEGSDGSGEPSGPRICQHCSRRNPVAAHDKCSACLVSTYDPSVPAVQRTQQDREYLQAFRDRQALQNRHPAQPRFVTQEDILGMLMNSTVPTSSSELRAVAGHWLYRLADRGRVNNPEATGVDRLRAMSRNWGRRL